MKKKFLYITILTGLLLPFAFVSCEDKIDPLITEIETSRLFSPTGIVVSNGQTQANIRWNAAVNTEGKAITYAVEVSKDLSFDVIAYSFTTTSTEANITNSNIVIKQNHYARIKATGEGIEDSGWMVSPVFQITGEQIFIPIAPAELAYNAATLRWNVGTGDVTTLKVTPLNGSSVEHTLTPAEKTASAKALTGLIPATQYTAEIFNGATLRGTLVFTTLSLAVPPAARTIYLDNTHVFSQTTFDTLTASSVTFVFPQGSVYGVNGATGALVLKANTDFNFYGVPGANKAIMAFNGFTLPATGGKIKFENVDLTGFEYVAGVVTATKRAYIINQSAASTTSEIAFENCIIRNFENTPFRLQGANAILVSKLKVNNCIVFDISAGGQNYAFINSAGTGTPSQVDNIEITNSTFYNVKIGLILHATKPTQSLTINSCTIYDISTDTRALIDYNTQAVPTFVFTANIVSKHKSPLNTARGIRIGGASVVVPASSYITSDYVPSTNPIAGATAYAGASTALFVNPTAGNFNFLDANFAGKSTSGDPRWRQ